MVVRGCKGYSNPNNMVGGGCFNEYKSGINPYGSDVFPRTSDSSCKK